MTARPIRDRLVEAAFALFAERGYEQTTVEDIAERAQVGRTTFFRQYRSKEDVIFPDHDRLTTAVAAQLSDTVELGAVEAVCNGARLVLRQYLDEGERARQRYALTRKVTALRDREIASVARYQRLFRDHLAKHSQGVPDADLQAEICAAAVVSAHNHVLRRWLQGRAREPMRELDSAITVLLRLFANPSAESFRGATVLVIEDPRGSAAVAALVQRALAGSPGPPSSPVGRQRR